MMTGALGTPAWSAPELLQGLSYTAKIDVYSYGICLWELVTRLAPYQGMASTRIMMGVCSGMRPLIPLSTGDEMSRLIQDCWHEVPRLRPDFAQVLHRLKLIANKVPQ